MFSRTQLFGTRHALTETFHTTTDQPTRERAFALVVKINERLLRGWNGFTAFPPGWSDRLGQGA